MYPSVCVCHYMPCSVYIYTHIIIIVQYYTIRPSKVSSCSLSAQRYSIYDRIEYLIILNLYQPKMFGEGSPLLNPWFTMRLQQGRNVAIIIPERCTYRQIDGYIARVGGNNQKRYEVRFQHVLAGIRLDCDHKFNHLFSIQKAQKCSENPQIKISAVHWTFWFREMGMGQNLSLLWGNNHPFTSYICIPSGYQGFDP